VLTREECLKFSFGVITRSVSRPWTRSVARRQRSSESVGERARTDVPVSQIHHDKHHAKYVNVANQMIEGTEMENDDTATIVMKAHKAGNQVCKLGRCCRCADATSCCMSPSHINTHLDACALQQFLHSLTHTHTHMQALFNNAAQSWNHDFYWKCMKPKGGGEVFFFVRFLFKRSKAQVQPPKLLLHLCQKRRCKGKRDLPQESLHDTHTHTHTHTGYRRDRGTDQEGFWLL
jgi:superoxide dismutase